MHFITKSLPVQRLPVIGRGAHGVALDAGAAVLKLTNSEKEYAAACRLMEETPSWSCRIFDTWRYQTDMYGVLKEKVTPVKFGTSYPSDEGCFHGMPWHAGEFENLASCPAEYNGEPRRHLGNRVFSIQRLEAEKIDFLASLYPSENEQACFRWFVNAFWQVKEAGYATGDLWSNIARTDAGTFVFYDIMLL
ncbi:hypothetical protein [Paraflavitalea sp. CAU 1676]|uniref:hypothetical protein n=1 Tax=Paraflavitalea sp. CAU 1676 TaxID=3032598 RepID=UPI0023DA9373|nr:hypothetical protein [Paraflavitalea sp. CAU 1676]MDF2188405.1 hypothetical protein [Paraflavitalea sp. CAU 1676]